MFALFAAGTYTDAVNDDGVDDENVLCVSCFLPVVLVATCAGDFGVCVSSVGESG